VPPDPGRLRQLLWQYLERYPGVTRDSPLAELVTAFMRIGRG
jgi:hypothetical protein